MFVPLLDNNGHFFFMKRRSQIPMHAYIRAGLVSSQWQAPKKHHSKTDLKTGEREDDEQEEEEEGKKL